MGPARRKGDRVSVSAEMAFRVEKDIEKDADVPDKQKLKLVRFGNVSFEPLTVRGN